MMVSLTPWSRGFLFHDSRFQQIFHNELKGFSFQYNKTLDQNQVVIVKQGLLRCTELKNLSIRGRFLPEELIIGLAQVVSRTHTPGNALSLLTVLRVNLHLTVKSGALLSTSMKEMASLKELYIVEEFRNSSDTKALGMMIKEGLSIPTLMTVSFSFNMLREVLVPFFVLAKKKMLCSRDLRFLAHNFDQWPKLSNKLFLACWVKMETKNWVKSRPEVGNPTFTNIYAKARFEFLENRYLDKVLRK